MEFSCSQTENFEMEKLSSDTGYFKKPVEINRGIVNFFTLGDNVEDSNFFHLKRSVNFEMSFWYLQFSQKMNEKKNRFYY
jgi:hypothetical protein